MKAYLQILGQRSPEGLPSVILQSDNQRYLFNCREGTQRLFLEEKLKFAKLQNIFLTRLTWDGVGGMPGMILTLTDNGISRINLHGPTNLTHLMVASRNFVYRTQATVETHEFDQASKAFHDGHLTVTPVVVLPNDYSESKLPSAGMKRPRSNSDSERSARLDPFANSTVEEKMAYRRTVLSQMFTNETDDAPGHTIEAPCTPRQHPLSKSGKNLSEVPDAEINMIPLKERHAKASVSEIPSDVSPRSEVQKTKFRNMEYLFQPLPPAKPFPAAISYICRGPTLLGKFNKQAALALGINPGPIYGKLHKGETVTLEDGRVITPDQVSSPPVPGYLFLIVDCPDISYVDNLISSPSFEKYQTIDETDSPSVIVHLVGDDVLQDARYRQWMNRFNPKTEHIIGTQDICSQPVLFEKHALGQYRLSKLNDSIFPIPKYDNNPAKTLDQFNDLPAKCFPLTNMIQADLVPKSGVVQQSLNKLLFDHTNKEHPDIKKIEANEEYAQAVTAAKEEAGKVDLSEQFPGEDVEVITLGTGSAIPSRYRNVSGTLIKIPGYGSILLDAGESTYGQMMRRFGQDRLEKEIRDIKCIFVSHLHADHHLGVMRLLTKLHALNQRGENKRTFLVAPGIFRNWLEEYSHIEPIDQENIIPIFNEFIVPGKQVHPSSPYAKSNFPQFGRLLPESLKKSRNNLVELRKELGLRKFDAVEVFHCRWAYGLTLEHESGWKLVYSGDTRPCDNLIESGQNATLLIHEASMDDDMLAEAIAKRHSTTKEAVEVGESQRYAKMPKLSEEQKNVCFSFDLMSVSIKQIPLLRTFTQAIEILFKDEELLHEEEIESISKNTHDLE
ncbi:Zinc phosphodiesterase ELAC protein 2 [Apophysomyces ossiformis]|uniref:ribonuclease Z n=1 Tax=Apophysomyces ossiformis TaxID=679940 RepID=A0A8H7BQ21_9FUNG|nr:Zinc phosphodiesterase ELAC protein 2 [Apophysomyces ossiformis]